MSIKIKAFTLLEFFCALAITVFVMSLCSIKIHKTIQKRRFFANVQLLENSLKLCQKLAVLYQEDSLFSLSQDGKGTSMKMGLSGGQSFLKDHAVETKTFSNLLFYFENESLHQFDIGFSSTGRVFPSGKLLITSKKQKFSQTIDLEKIVSVKDAKKPSLNQQFL